MRYLDDAEAIWESSGDKNVHAEGSGSIDQDVEGNLHVKETVIRLEVNGNIGGSVHVHGDAHVEIDGDIGESLFVEEGCTVIVEGDVKGNVNGSDHATVSGKVGGSSYKE